MSVKLSEDGVQKLIEAITERRRRVADVEKLGRVREYPEWQHFLSLLQNGIQVRERYINTLIDSERDYSETDFKLTVREHRVARDQLRAIIELIKDPAIEVKRLTDEIEKFEKDIKEAQPYLGGS